jgi:DNA-binding MarR family transcriptional regulator
MAFKLSLLRVMCMRDRFTDPTMHLLRRLWHVYNNILREGQRFLRRYRLTPIQLDVITLLSSAEGITQQELSKHLLTTKSNITSLIDRMERKGLVERHIDAYDKRCYRLFLTQKSKHLLECVLPEYKKRISQFFSTLSERERKQLQSLLKRLERSLTPGKESEMATG